ncbi:HPr family phosphocarrier protein [Pengzhenrongella frigida]|uniref:Phosphocarrier protein HPr n=1 Tax=Pengzhenrongella frigida TaxID=1259133 RepID=A0A4Q5N2J3_9MICO|nr:HPr family phosphocarrier protein [Cellulomonas sp. HLT2-17]RYV52369.1 HPr family phosphocarrier protein [Cellulomonas sp. HLT2-17]
MLERRVTVAIAEGLHARPAAMFAKLAGEQSAKVTIGKVGGEQVATDSILGVMTLGAGFGDVVLLQADDEGAAEALAVLAEYLATED